MKNYALSVFLLSILMGCSKEDINTSEQEKIAKCYKENPVEELTWLNDVVKPFQEPKSGTLKVSSYRFRESIYLVASNGFVSCPSCYIFDCQGQTINQLNINYNTFISEAILIKVFLNQTY